MEARRGVRASCGWKKARRENGGKASMVYRRSETRGEEEIGEIEGEEGGAKARVKCGGQRRDGGEMMRLIG